MKSSDKRFDGLQLIEEMQGDDAEDTLLLQEMAAEAEVHLCSQKWCSAAKCRYFGGGIGKIFAVFLCRVEPAQRDINPWMWVMVGDVPRAYLPLEDAANPAQVFRLYIDGMNRWVELARRGETGTADQGIPPVDVPATPDMAEALQRRLDMLVLLVQPLFEKQDRGESIN